MILAQNRLPLLSGNKILAAFVLPIVLISCGAFKKSARTVEWPEDEEIVVIEPTKPEAEPVPKPIPPKKDEIEQVYTTAYFKGESFRVPVHKQDFHIAIMLPFHQLGTSSTQDERRGALMLEYYQGIKLAIPEIENLGSKFTFHFFDTDNDTTRLKLLLNKPEMEDIDLIIGPTDEDQVRIAAYFARKREIPLFSPITSNYSIWSDNPYLFNLNPSDNQQAKAFIRYFRKYHNGEKLILLRDGKKFDLSFGQALVDELKNEKLNYSIVPYSRYVKWVDYMDEGKAVVLSTVQDKTSTLYTVNSLLGRAPRVTLMGPDSWLEFSSVDYSYWEKLKVCFIGTNAAEIKNEQSEVMLQRFHSQYKGEPSWFTYMGYDHILFTCELLDAFGKYFPLFVENKVVPYSNTNFNLVKQDGAFHNQYIQVFQFRDKEVIPVSMQ
ncbi:MAG: hypothetical protein RLZZ337_687 [Bacteroidota bacterium]|jgi:hypothetical protein